MASRLNRARIMRTAVAVAAVAVPLSAAGSAHAAIAGASPSVTSVLPDLVSAASTGSSSIEVCYDKALASNSPVFQASGYGDIYVSDYLSGAKIEGTQGELSPTSVTPTTSNPDCLNAQFNPLNQQVDLGAGTIVSDTANAVNASSGGGQNLADSVTLSTSSTSNGTTGHTNGPDLTSVAANFTVASTNGLTYTFDQNVDPDNINPADFGYVTAQGVAVPAPTTASSFSYSGNTVIVDYGTPASSATAVGSAVQGYVLAGGVYSAVNGNTGYETANQTSDYAVTGTSGDSGLPTLVSASLSNNYTAVTYTFNHPVNSTVQVADLGVALSDGSELTGTGDAYSVSGDVVTVTYGAALANVAEYAVQAIAQGNAAGPSADAAPTGTANTAPFTSDPSYAPLGGNAGALARGFTTGPDVESVTDQGTSGTAGEYHTYSVSVDQRVNNEDDDFFDDNDITLLNAAGQVVGTSEGVRSSGTSVPGQETVLVYFSPTVASGTQLDFGPAAFDTNLGGGDSDNSVSVPQIVSLTGSAAHVKAAHLKKHAKKHSKKHSTKKH